MTAMHRLWFFFLIPYVLAETTQLLQTCTSCGPECESSCGSRNFRTCCYNYFKKRSPIPPIPPPDSPLRTKIPWLSTLVDGTSSNRNSGVDSDRDVEVQLFLSPDWLSSDSLNHYQDFNSNYQENPLIGRLVGLTDVEATEAPVVDNPDTSSAETSNGETNQEARTNEKGHGGRGIQRRYQPLRWNTRHQHQHSNYPWSEVEVNRRLPMYGA